ncbi:hypothetical protein D0T49_05360 [Paludibacter sp. 221]|uniref:hypothetical protein n=1 Tax=Paludibacter sp. 221 TaxID=2302939 RepID=UPI0013D4E0F9|nr:hypothetical protein [Paludibacter sp. 221]NDV46468.1 hypothetical protein [Paludibacter sp. 221]
MFNRSFFKILFIFLSLLVASVLATYVVKDNYAPVSFSGDIEHYSIHGSYDNTPNTTWGKEKQVYQNKKQNHIAVGGESFNAPQELPVYQRRNTDNYPAQTHETDWDRINDKKEKSPSYSADNRKYNPIVNPNQQIAYCSFSEHDMRNRKPTTNSRANAQGNTISTSSLATVSLNRGSLNLTGNSKNIIIQNNGTTEATPGITGNGIGTESDPVVDDMIPNLTDGGIGTMNTPVGNGIKILIVMAILFCVIKTKR